MPRKQKSPLQHPLSLPQIFQLAQTQWSSMMYSQIELVSIKESVLVFEVALYSTESATIDFSTKCDLYAANFWQELHNTLNDNEKFSYYIAAEKRIIKKLPTWFTLLIFKLLPCFFWQGFLSQPPSSLSNLGSQMVLTKIGK